MADKFVTLATLVRESTAGPVAAAPQPESATLNPGPQVAASEPAGLCELALLRLAASEAFERASVLLLRDLADHVLARELQQSPAAVEELVTRALAQYAAQEPVEIALCASDAARVRVSLPVRVDPALAAGDVVVYVRDGAFESHFAFRLETVLAWSAERSAV